MSIDFKFASVSTNVSGIEQVRDSLFGREGKMIIAPRTDTLILAQLDFVNDLVAAGTFLEQALRNGLAFLPIVCFERGFFENGHGLCARGRGGVNGKRARLAQNARAFAQSGAGR